VGGWNDVRLPCVGKGCPPCVGKGDKCGGCQQCRAPLREVQLQTLGASCLQEWMFQSIAILALASKPASQHLWIHSWACHSARIDYQLPDGERGAVGGGGGGGSDSSACRLKQSRGHLEAGRLGGSHVPPPVPPQAEPLTFAIVDNLRRPPLNISYILREGTKTFTGYARSNAPLSFYTSLDVVYGENNGHVMCGGDCDVLW
jgi:hypothetical protein